MASAATRLRAPQTEPSASAGVATLLADAAQAVAAQWEQAATLRGETAPAVAALHVLGDAIRAALAGEPLPSLHAYSWTAEAPRLLAGLRRELLRLAATSAVSANDVLLTLTQMERLLHALEEDASARFAEHVLGPNALELLVEVAHDMRSPLGSIQFLVERMRCGQTGPVSPMQERHLGLVYSAAFGLSALASDVMELAQGGARLVGPSVVPFSISEVLHAVRDVIQPIAEEKGLTVRFSGPPNDVRLGHPAALHRVLLNLVTNALKFTNSGAVTVQVDAVTAIGGTTSSTVRFLVSDTGRGMPASVTARLSDDLGGAAAPDTESVFSSAGLGLAICQKLVAAMGGRLSILGTDRHGTRLDFVLDLPVAS